MKNLKSVLLAIVAVAMASNLFAAEPAGNSLTVNAEAKKMNDFWSLY